MATKIWKHRNTSDGWSLASEWITSEFPAAGDGVVPAGSTTPDAVTGNATRSSSDGRQSDRVKGLSRGAQEEELRSAIQSGADDRH
jgi:hypothetical protein